MGSKSRDFRSDLHLFFVIFILRSLFLQTALFSSGFHLKCGEIRQKSTHKCGFLPASFLSMQLGARGGSRTRTPLRALAPEASESTNSTTRACVEATDLSLSTKLMIPHCGAVVNTFFAQIFYWMRRRTLGCIDAADLASAALFPSAPQACNPLPGLV